MGVAITSRGATWFRNMDNVHILILELNVVKLVQTYRDDGLMKEELRKQRSLLVSDDSTPIDSFAN